MESSEQVVARIVGRDLDSSELDRYPSFDADVLGSMAAWLAKEWNDSGFIGRKEPSRKLGFGYVSLSQTPTYAVWDGLRDSSTAAAFLAHLIAKHEEP